MADGDQVNPQVDPQKIAALIQAMQGNASGLTGTGQAPPPDSTAGAQPSAPQPVDPRIALLQAMRGDSSALPRTPTAQPQAQGGALPPTSPIDMQQIYRQFASQPEIAQPRAQMEDIRRQLAEKQQQYESMPRPKMGWLDTQGQAQPTGFGHSLMRALTALAASTVPGRAVQNAVYGPGIERYGMERQSLADQIATLRDQAGVSEKELGSGQALAGTAGMTGYRQGELGIQQMNANTRQIAEQHRNENTQRRNEIMQQLGQGRLSQEQARTEIMKLNNELGQRRLQAMTQLMAQGQQLHWDEATLMNQRSLLETEFNKQVAENLEAFKLQVEHPIQSMTGNLPAAPQLPSLTKGTTSTQPAQPTQPTKPTSKKPPQTKNPHSDLGVIYPGQP